MRLNSLVELNKKKKNKNRNPGVRRFSRGKFRRSPLLVAKGEVLLVLVGLTLCLVNLFGVYGAKNSVRTTNGRYFVLKLVKDRPKFTVIRTNYFGS